MLKRQIVTLILAFSLTTLTAQTLPYKKRKLIYKDNFNTDLSGWVVESPADQNPWIGIKNRKLNIEVTGGATVWLKRPLSGNYMIEFKRKVVVAGGPRDRLSDFNMFWAATDPVKPTIFTRTGVLEEYESLNMYYAAVGGNSNSTTRFRKYQGNGERTLLKEYTDKNHLLVPNKEYLVRIIKVDGKVELYLDDQQYFSYQDPQPLQNGYFGIRTTKSHHEVDNFKVYKLN